MPTSEFDLIYRYFSSLGAGPAVDLSVGDDCAILRLEPNERLATSVDTMVEGVHFPEDMFPEDIGFRAVSVAASDLAAMGARPIGMTVALTLPEADEFWINTFSQGIAQAVSEYRLPLVGGDTTRGPLTISVQVMGALPADKALLREGAQVGDLVYVSGTLGDAAGALAFLNGEWHPEPDAAEFLLQRFHRPRARVELGRELLGKATSAIDISDGLLADAGHIAAASGVSIDIECGRVPLSSALNSHPDSESKLKWALSGGDDYELCLTLPEEVPTPEGCTRIGRVTKGQGVKVDQDIDFTAGYQHF
ncbi:thiamine-phosphate kinase [Halieaceae bacterium IMCC8485]|uniref:Thiamine-monophosphate kinase n=1 Tax=Candidatus Seongchinamella marina TaxID=2518990 RepID=A0ABT3T088_9GAMM|nr:thiamine-phosphate kinase [Candidatus Seongchinamella marina]MCX2975670.1 thiamine-phosphate kinase [Candidatus Seongchinamella marina]